MTTRSTLVTDLDGRPVTITRDDPTQGLVQFQIIRQAEFAVAPLHHLVHERLVCFCQEFLNRWRARGNWQHRQQEPNAAKGGAEPSRYRPSHSRSPRRMSIRIGC